MTAGVYAIQNDRTGFAYVGSSYDIEKRLSGHRSDLRRGKHPCNPLRSAWTARPSEFSEVVLAVVPEPTNAALIDHEQLWLDRYRGRLYNANPRASRGDRSHLVFKSVMFRLSAEEIEYLDSLKRRSASSRSAVLSGIIAEARSRRERKQ